ncbi:hypothetical protein [Endozoicomonas numazuensis]|nr:hypothetical protein [Endozoicomonas numazuensis]
MKEMIFEKFLGDTREYEEELIFPKELCMEFIQECRLHKVAILGIEGYLFLPDKCVKPVIDEVADFSDLSSLGRKQYVDESVYSAEEFLKHMLKNGVSDGYSFVLD